MAWTVKDAAAATGWSARMLRYIEGLGLIAPERSAGGYRIYAEHDIARLRELRVLRERFDVELGALALVARLRREPDVRAAVQGWFARGQRNAPRWLDWEQAKQERLLAA
jgi:adenosylhomocysteinase